MAGVMIETKSKSNDQSTKLVQNETVFCEWLSANKLEHLCDACIAEGWDDLYVECCCCW